MVFDALRYCILIRNYKRRHNSNLVHNQRLAVHGRSPARFCLRRLLFRPKSKAAPHDKQMLARHPSHARFLPRRVLCAGLTKSKPRSILSTDIRPLDKVISRQTSTQLPSRIFLFVLRLRAPKVPVPISVRVCLVPYRLYSVERSQTPRDSYVILPHGSRPKVQNEQLVLKWMEMGT